MSDDRMKKCQAPGCDNLTDRGICDECDRWVDGQVAEIALTDKIRQIFADVVEVPIIEVHDDDELRTFGEIDSLDLAEFFMRVEERFDIELPDRECAGFKTVGDVSRSVARKLEKTK